MTTAMAHNGGEQSARQVSIAPSSRRDAACARLLDDLGAWVRQCLAAYGEAPATDCHDQGTYTTAWHPWHAAHNDPALLDFLRVTRDRIRARFTQTGQWTHGYWTMQEAHHGTEHFELFLGALWRLDPQDGDTIAHLVDAAEHLGNWSPAVPAWFDWDTGLFRAMHFGAAGVCEDAGEALNMPDHFRCVNIALLALEMTGDARYLALARTHTGRWVEAILADAHLPLGLLPLEPMYGFTPETEATYRAFAGMAGTLVDDIDRAENLLASGAIQALLRLWTRTGEADYRAAAERLLDMLATQLADPDAGAVADAIRQYRRLTGSSRYDAAVRAATAAFFPSTIRALSLAPGARRPRRPSGVGKRVDLPYWQEDGAPRRWNPITLAVAAEISGDDALATAALDLARAYFTLARQAFPDGREHGCAAQTVSAVARGHGRDNHAGVITAVLHPLILPTDAFRP